MKNVALICNSAFGTDGISMFVMNNHRFFSHEGAVYHLIYSSTHSKQEVIDTYINDWCKDGDKACFIPKKNGLAKYAKQLHRYLVDNHVDVIHVQGSSAAVLAEMVVAKISGVKKIIVHSHNTSGSHNTIHRILRPLVNIFANERLACGEKAGRWMYGKKKQFTVVPNCIDTESYRFNRHVRDDYRIILQLQDDEIVIGHVGKFSDVKNQSFLLKLLDSLGRRGDKHYKLLLVGHGPLEDQVKEECSSLGLDGKVLFLGNRDDVANLMMAMDVFCMPSLYEGFPIVAVEAQASGLPLLISSNVSPEVKITDIVSFLPIDKGTSDWENEIIRVAHTTRIREYYDDKIKEAGYDISQSAAMLESIYTK